MKGFPETERVLNLFLHILQSQEALHQKPEHQEIIMLKHWLYLTVFSLFLLLSGTARATSERVNIPLTIDYPMLRALVIASAFTEPEESRTILDKNGGCIRLVIADPQYTYEEAHLRLDIRVSIMAGQLFAGECHMPVRWDGYFSFLQIPLVDNENLHLSFQTVDSSVFNLQHQPVKIADFLWNLVKQPVHDYLSTITVNLAPPVTELKKFLLPLFPEENLVQTRQMLDSMQFGDVRSTENGLKINLLADVQSEETPPDTTVPILTDTQLLEIVTSWEYWDEFIVQIITMLSENPLTDTERQTLLDILLDLRYRFAEGLSAQTIGKDLVRVEFVKTWQQLGPIFKNHIGTTHSDNILGYLSFFTSSDALVALDRLGPTLGIEISRYGLLRLLLMLDEQATPFSYDASVNQELRKTLGLSAVPPSSRTRAAGADQEREELNLDPTPFEEYVPLDDDKWIDDVQSEPEPSSPPATDSSIAPARKEKDNTPHPNQVTPRDEANSIFEAPSDDSLPYQTPPDTPQKARDNVEMYDHEPEGGNQEKKHAIETVPLTKLLLDFFLPAACAAEKRAPPQLKDVRQWLVTRKNREQYLSKVRKILADSAANTLAKNKRSSTYSDFYRDLVIASAWQESCFRQFHVKDRKLTFLRSYNKSSVGIMQINERVWRSLYNLNQLRWDIYYNIDAGVEILDLYVNKYTLKKLKSPALKDKELAGVIYAMYNGGPAQLEKFMARSRKNSLYKSDKLFQEKYSWTREKKWENIDNCLSGI